MHDSRKESLTMDFNFQSAPDLQQFFQADIKRTRKILGKGSFGTVELVTLSGAPCAAKKLHSILIDVQVAERQKFIQNFKRECHIMSMLRHPNIVQFLGLCTFEDSRYPIILMECLDTCLHRYLTKEGKGSSLAESTKISILLDVASGLSYLHWHNPPIIHRDLTANNVLLSLPAVQAKISDLGNSCMIKLQSFSAVLTQQPGTAVYMPPEAMEEASRYDCKLDIFSFGHLALFTMLQVYPCNLFSATHMHKGQLLPRSEVHRRSEYIYELKCLLGTKHSIVKLIEECLDNIPRNRPSAKKILKELNKQPNVREPPKRDRDATVHESVRLEAKINLIRNGSPGWLEYAIIQGRKKEVIWKKYLFLIANTTHLQHFRSATRTDRATGELKLSQVKQVQKMNGLRFAISFNGKGTPWILKASDEEERTCWMEAILPGTSQLYEKTPDIKTSQQHSYVSMKSHFERTPEPPGALYDEPSVLPITESDCGTRSDYYPLKNHPEVPEYDYPLQNHPEIPEYEHIPEHFHQGANQPPLYDNITLPPTNEGRKDYGHQDSFSEKLPENFSQEQYAELKKMFWKLENASMSNKSNSQAIPQVPQATDAEKPTPDYVNLRRSRLPSQIIVPPDIKVEGPEHMYTNSLTPNQTCHRRPSHGNAKQAFLRHSPHPSPHPSPHHTPHPSPHPSPHHSPHHSPHPSPLPSRRHSPYPSPNTSPEHGTYGKHLAMPPRHLSIGTLLKQWGPLSSKMLITGDSEDYELYPEWARARTDFSDLSTETESSLRFKVPNIMEADLLNMRRIGAGEFGFVYKAQFRSRGNTQVAVKTIKRYESEKETRDFMREMGAMSQVMHPNIIKLYGLVQEKFWLVIEYMSNGDLKHFLMKHKRPIGTLVKYMIDVTMGMHYLSEKGLLHRDLAARNVMVSEKEICKIADFGLMRKLPDDEQYYFASTTAKQPIRWMAPESFTEKKYSPASDVWSFGILIWEMFNPTKIPYEDLDNMQCAVYITSGYRLPIPPDCPSTVANIIKACWQNKASKRPSFLLISMLLTNMNFHT